MVELSSKIDKVCAKRSFGGKSNVKSLKSTVKTLLDQGMEQKDLNRIFRCHIKTMDLETARWFLEDLGAKPDHDPTHLWHALRNDPLGIQGCLRRDVPLMESIFNRDIGKVELLLKHGAKVVLYEKEDSWDGLCFNLLSQTISLRFEAMQRNHRDKLKMYFKAIKLLIEYDPSCVSACEYGFEGFDPDTGLKPIDVALGAQGRCQMTPSEVTPSADYGVFKLLLENGCYINGSDDDVWESRLAPMHHALSLGDYALVQFIACQEGFDPNLYSYALDLNYLLYAFDIQADFSLILILLEQGMDPMPSWTIEYCYHSVVTENRNKNHLLLRKLFVWLLDSEYSSHAIMRYFDPLPASGFNTRVSNGSDLTSSNPFLVTSQLFWKDPSRVEVLDWLFQKGVDPNAVNEKGQTDLIQAFLSTFDEENLSYDRKEEIICSVCQAVRGLVIWRKLYLAAHMPGPSTVLNDVIVGTNHKRNGIGPLRNMIDFEIKDMYGKSLRDYATELSISSIIEALGLEDKIHISMEGQI